MGSESPALMKMSSRPSYFDSDEWVEYDETLRMAAERHGVHIVSDAQADGIWDGNTEPSGAYLVESDSIDQVKAWAAEMAGRYRQDAVMVGEITPDGDAYSYTYATPQTTTPAEAIASLRAAGIHGATLTDGRLHIVSTDGALSSDAENIIAARYGTATVDRANVDFVTGNNTHQAHSPVKEIQMLRQNYADTHNIPARTRIPHLTEHDDIACAMVYHHGDHQPTHPTIQRSYRVFRQHITQQWNMLTDAGYRFDPWHGDTEQPYPDSAAMIADVRNNKHLYYYPTETGGDLTPDHPMLKNVTVTTPDGTTRTMLANDVFRAVHDTLAHTDGHQFGPTGEKRAWWVHRSCLPPEARLALWNETRAQNCWTNTGPPHANHHPRRHHPPHPPHRTRLHPPTPTPLRRPKMRHPTPPRRLHLTPGDNTMMGTSHAITGAATWLALTPLHTTDPLTTITGTLLTAGAALTPDWDHPSSTVAHALPAGRTLATGISTLTGGHRKALHSLLAATTIALITPHTTLLTITTPHWPTPIPALTLALTTITLTIAFKTLRLTHTWPTSWLLALAATAATALLPGHLLDTLPAALTLGYLAHLAGDLITTGGIPLLWPLTIRPPKTLTTLPIAKNIWLTNGNIALPILGNTGSWREWILATTAALFVAWSTITTTINAL